MTQISRIIFFVVADFFVEYKKKNKTKTPEYGTIRKNNESQTNVQNKFQAQDGFFYRL